MRLANFFAVAGALAASLVGAFGEARAADNGPQNYLLLKYATPAAAQDAAYDAWRRNTQAPAYFRVAGIRSAQFYELADTQNRPRQAGVNPAIPQPAKFLTVYTISTAKLDATLKASLTAVKTMKGAPAPASAERYDWVYRAITPVNTDKAGGITEKEPLNTYRLFVFANSKSGRDDQFNAEYNGTHAPGVLVNRGFTDWQRFVMDDKQIGTTPNNKYLALYTIRTADLKGVYDDMRKKRVGRPQTSGPDPREKQAYDYSNDYSETYRLTGEADSKAAR
jgi:hypothetical protein